MSRRIALVTHDLSLGGGVATMAGFLHRVLSESGRFEPEIISLATSASDRASVQLRAPKTWRRGPEVRRSKWRNLDYIHVGAWGSELEFQRYRNRSVLTDLLCEYDAVQFVVGTPPWACVASGVRRPVLLWMATTTEADRVSRISSGPLLRRRLSVVMTRIAQLYERRALRDVHTIFALTRYTAAAVQSLVWRDSVVLAPCGVDTDLFHPGTSPDRPYILCVARFSDPRKNVNLLLSAYATLKRRSASVPGLCLVGELPSTQVQKLLGELGIADAVHMTGVKEGDELAELYRNALFFVLSSDEEGLGIVILEAMASGLPVVSTACGGPATVVEDGKTGLLTPVGDAQALAEAMQRLLSDPALRRSLGCEARRTAEERFSLSATGKIFLEQYDLVLER
jgi:glycosyltransferase involved in cell wall biosynthesis